MLARLDPDPIIEAMCLAAIPKIMALEPDVRARDMAGEELATILKAAYLAALPMIAEQCAQVAEQNSCACVDSFCDIKQTSNYIQDAILALAAAKVEELSRE